MINFELTDDHKAIQQTVRDFASKEVAPRIKELDEKQIFDASILDKMADLNLPGVCIPEEYGGAGFDYISLGLVCEELEAVDTFMRVIMSVHTGLNSLTLYTWGTEEQKRKYLVPQAKGERIATYGLTEPGAGSDAANIKTSARRDGDDWIINGEKTFITGGNDADFAIVIAVTDPERTAHTGATAFLVDRSMGWTSHFIQTMGEGGPASLVFDEVRVPGRNVLGEVGQGFELGMT